jgi:hypothetical protein
LPELFFFGVYIALCFFALEQEETELTDFDGGTTEELLRQSIHASVTLATRLPQPPPLDDTNAQEPG